MKFRTKKLTDQNIDISPLIDMVFILLIFFMVTSTFTKDMKVDLQRPGASTATKASTKILKVYIDKDSQVYIDNQPIKVWALQSKVRDMLRNMAEKNVLIVTDEGIKVERLIDVIDQCRKAGAKDVAVATNKEVE